MGVKNGGFVHHTAAVRCLYTPTYLQDVHSSHCEDNKLTHPITSEVSVPHLVYRMSKLSLPQQSNIKLVVHIICVCVCVCLHTCMHAFKIGQISSKERKMRRKIDILPDGTN